MIYPLFLFFDEMTSTGRLDFLKSAVYAFSLEVDFTSDHGWGHFLTVLEHAQNAAYSDSKLSPEQREMISCAALIHDVDEDRYYRKPVTSYNLEGDYPVARQMCDQMSQEIPTSDQWIHTVLVMVDLVSCRKNKNSQDVPEWMLYPRYADRMDALGKEGIARCYLVTIHRKNPLFTQETPRATTVDELAQIATQERFANYDGKSLSMVDHFYDKLLHLSKVSINNCYLQDGFDTRKSEMVEFCLQFGRTGTVDQTDLKNLATSLGYSL